MSRRLPSPQVLWERHVERVIRVLFLALERLHAHKGIPVGEEELDRLLYVTIREVYHHLPKPERPQSIAELAGKGEQTPVDPQDVNTDWVRKRPDFKWRMQNNLAVSPQELTKDFDIESKRLGTGVLTKKYVVNGINRFISGSHRYGNGVNDGAMIGYIQDSQLVDVLNKVNSYIAKAGKGSHTMPPISFPVSDHLAQPVTTARQKLARVHVRPCDFTLHHLWVDLRGNQ